MSLRVYNTLSRQKELFETVAPGKVGMYLCGPTVYKPPHIGHMVGPVIFDAIKRYLTFKGYRVSWVVNITDVDDKLIEAAHKQQTSIAELAAKYTGQYLKCLEDLGIDTIDHFPKASEHIAEIIDMCRRLIESNHAYEADGNVWFSVNSDPRYGTLSNRAAESQEAGGRALGGSGKRQAADFALWKTAKEGEPSWKAPWGQGRPGWHIECSAMSMKLLGETFDIHGGGMDLLFPHHENEMAQSECCTGKPFVRYWLHNGLTRIRTKLAGGQWADEKMSGSLGNVVSARELIDQYGPELLRYFLLSTHYRRPIEFTDEVLENNRKALGVFDRLWQRVARLCGKDWDHGTADMDQAANDLLAGEDADFVQRVLELKMKFMEMMDDDFNTAGAIAVLHEAAGAVNGFIEQNALERGGPGSDSRRGAVVAAALTMQKLGRVLGLFRFHSPAASAAGQDQLAEALMQLLIELRAQARQSKNFALADAIRNGLTQRGVSLEDRPEGTVWSRTGG